MYHQWSTNPICKDLIYEELTQSKNIASMANKCKTKDLIIHQQTKCESIMFKGSRVGDASGARLHLNDVCGATINLTLIERPHPHSNLHTGHLKQHYYDNQAHKSE